LPASRHPTRVRKLSLLSPGREPEHSRGYGGRPAPSSFLTETGGIAGYRRSRSRASSPLASRGAKSRAALSVQSKASRPATPSFADGLTRTVAGEPRSHQRAQCIELRARWPMGALGFCHDDVTDCLLIGQRFDVPASKLDASSSATSMGWWLWSTDPPSSLALPEVTPRSVLQRTHGARHDGLAGHSHSLR